MAVWEFQMTGLEITGHDSYGWPITRLVDLTMNVQEYNTLKLYKNAWKEAEAQFPNCCAFNIKSVERVDKQTDKDYGFRDDPTMLVYQLSPSQQEELQEMRGEILKKVMGDSKPRDLISFLAGGDVVEYITDDMAWLKGYPGIFLHADAEKVIKALQKFYSRITPEELTIFRVDRMALSHADLEAVRTYRAAALAAT